MLSDSLDAKTKQTVCTQIGGGIATFCFYPVDTIRFRTMSHDNTNSRLHNNSRRYRGIINPGKLVVEHEGVAALYRGVTVAVGGAVLSWGVYMYLFRSLQQLMQLYSGWAPNFWSDVALSTAASIGNAYVTTPVWHVKTRMQLEDTSGKAVSERRYSKFGRSLLAVCKSDGFFGLWRGFSPQLMMSTVNGVYFPVYQRCLEFVSKAHHHGHDGRKSHDDGHQQQTTHNSSPPAPPSTFDVAVASGGAKTLISMLSNPFFVLRTKLQDERHSIVPAVAYRNLVQAAAVIWKEEGISGFYRGMRAGIMITAPKSMLVMILTERLYYMVR